ncbi:MAG: sensor histidine kinase [Alphaproteobacteria bacterium]|nr:sensor histidine kinase [Alphaproteobacteria bacterium]
MSMQAPHTNEAVIIGRGSSKLHDWARRQRAARKSRGGDRSSQALIGATLNAMPTQVAILDDAGRILLVNKAWRYFAAALDRPPPSDLAGMEYLKSGVLGALGRHDALMLRLTLKAILRGDLEHAQRVIRMAGADRWYQVTIARFQNRGVMRIVVTHEDISAVHAAQETIHDLSQSLLDLQEQERQRIARELHDSTAQQLTAIGLGLITLRHRLGDDHPSIAALEEIESLVQDTQREVRTFSYLLHPPYLDQEGLNTTLSRFIDGYGRRTGLAMLTDIADEVDGVSPDVQRALLRIVQEALANVHRHAAASQVAVAMRVTNDTLRFSVRDNGRGIVRQNGGGEVKADALGLGLPGMHARVKQLGGTLQIVSGPEGTTVCGEVPAGC